MEATYDNVLPLLTSSRMDGATMVYTFTCPATGFTADGSAPIPSMGGASAASIGGSMAVGVGTGLGANALNRVAPGVGTALEAASGIFRFRKASKAAQQAQAVATSGDPAAAAQQLMLTAFTTVAPAFRWDDASGRWVKA